MYFPYFHSFAPQKSQKSDNYYMVMEFFGNQISKCPNQKKKMSPVLANRLLSSLSNKLKLFSSHSISPCSIQYYILVKGGAKKNSLNSCRSFCIIYLATNMLEGWDIFHLKGRIHSFVWSTKSFLYNIRELGYKQNNMGYQISRI